VHAAGRARHRSHAQQAKRASMERSNPLAAASTAEIIAGGEGRASVLDRVKARAAPESRDGFGGLDPFCARR